MRLNLTITHGMEIDSDCTDGASMNLQLSDSMCLRLVDAQEYQLTLAMGPIGHVNVVDLSNYYTKTEVNKKLSLKQDKTAPTTLIKVHHNIPINAQEGYVYTACNYYMKGATTLLPKERVIPYAVIKIKPVSGYSVENYVFDVTRFFPTLAKAQEMLRQYGPIAVYCYEQDGKIYAKYDQHEMYESWGETNEGAAKAEAVMKYLGTPREKIILLNFGRDYHFTYIKGQGLVAYSLSDKRSSSIRKFFEREIPIDEKMSKVRQLDYITKALRLSPFPLYVTDEDEGVTVEICPYCITSKHFNIEMQAYKKNTRLGERLYRNVYRWVKAKYWHKLQSRNCGGHVVDSSAGSFMIEPSKMQNGTQFIEKSGDIDCFDKKRSKLFCSKKTIIRARIRTGEWFYFHTDVDRQILKKVNYGE